MRRYLLPYLAFLASFVAFVWLLRGADEGAKYLAATVLALLVWRAVGNRSET